MAFTKKEWTDRVAEYINRRVLNKTDGTQEVVTVERSEGDVSVEGDAFNAANMNDLEDRIEAAFSGIELTAEKVEYDDTSTSLGSTTVQGAIEALKKFVSDGKSAIASAITKKGVSTSADATFAAMATNIANIPNANSGTYTPSSNGSALDMGATNTYRYVNTNTVYNSGYNSGRTLKTIGSYSGNKSVTVSGLPSDATCFAVVTSIPTSGGVYEYHVSESCATSSATTIKVSKSGNTVTVSGAYFTVTNAGNDGTSRSATVNISYTLYYV